MLTKLLTANAGHPIEETKLVGIVEVMSADR